MIEDARQGLFDALIVHKTDRFSRNRYDSIMYKNELSKFGVRVISVTENFGDGIEAELMVGIQESFNEFYSRNLGREVRKGLNELANKGLHTGGSPPLAYYIKGRTAKISQTKKKVVTCHKAWWQLFSFL